MSDWKVRAKAESTVDNDWKKRVIAQSRPFGLTKDDINDLPEADPMVRLEVGSLSKPEDRLKALQKHYSDATAYDDDNFLFTDEDGKVRQYNRSSWMPSLGDIASIAPEAGSAVGGGIGAILGGIGGGAAGSAVPIVGTGAGAISGGMLGAGTGSALGKEAVASGLNFIFGNTDSRTAAETAKDMGIEFAMGAVGDGTARALGAGAKGLGKAWRNYAVGGDVDDIGEAAIRAADLQAIGVNPTQGMIANNARTSTMEHALIPTRAGREIDRRITDANAAMGNEFDRITNSLGRPFSKAEAGEALQKQAQATKDAGFARSSDLYDDVAAKITSPAVVSNTDQFAQKLAAERAGYGQFDSLTKGGTTDKVIETTSALLSDAKNGSMTFDQLKQARTFIGQQAADTDDKVLKNHLNDLYGSLTADMRETAAASGEDALQAFNKANNQFKRLVSPETGFGKGSDAATLLNKNSDDVFNWATSGAKNGGDRIAAVRRQVVKSEGGQEAWNNVASGMIERLGKNSADEFDPGKFMREWERISPEAKKSLFHGTANKQYADDLDRLSRIAKNWTQNYRKYGNHSNTANHIAARDSLNPLSSQNAVASLFGMNQFGTTGMLLGAAKGAAAGTVNAISRGSRAKLLQNPEVVRIMAEMPSQMKKGGVAAQFGKLNQLRKRTTDQALAAALADYFTDNNYAPGKDDE